MSLTQSIKKLFWGSCAAIICVFSWILGTAQFIRNLLLEVAELPSKALSLVFSYVGILYIISCFFEGWALFDLICNLVTGLVVIFLAYTLFNLVCQFFCYFIQIIFHYLDFERIIVILAKILQKSILQYWGIFGNDENPTKKDRLLFAIPWLFHKLNWLVEKISSAVYLMYAIFGSATLYFSYQLVLGSTDTSSYSVGDYISGIAIIIGFTIIGIYIGHCAANAITMAINSVRPLDKLFEVYAEFFINNEEDSTKNYTYNYENSDYTHGKDYNNNSYQYESYKDTSYKKQEKTQTNYSQSNSNPYYAELHTAKTADELKKRYRFLAKQLHPDVCKDYSVEEATRRMALLNEAYSEMKKLF